MSTPTRALAAALALALGACVEYAPASAAAPPPAPSQVRVRLARPIDVPIRDVTVRDVVELQGEMIGTRDSTLRLSVFGLRSGTGFTTAAEGETVALPTANVAEIGRRRLSPLRSGIAAALLVGLGVALGASGIVTGTGATPGGHGGQPQ